MGRAIGIGLIVLLFGACGGSKKEKPNRNIPPKFVVEAKFTPQGTLSFMDEKGNAISTLTIELADTPAKREQGLMNRKSMEETQAMLFVFENEERQTFWMKDTDIALDLVFVNANKQIVHIAPNCQPYALDPIHSFEYAMYVVEVVAGYCNRNQIKVGQSIHYKLN